MVTVHPHLVFKGHCREAFQHYAATLGGEIVFSVTYGESPMASQTPAGWRDKIAHARLNIGSQCLLGADASPDRYRSPQGFSIMIGVADPAEATRVFNALAEQGSIEMPLQETFWARRFGSFTDRFGISWMVNCEKPLEFGQRGS
jgi:PhnB protein